MIRNQVKLVVLLGVFLMLTLVVAAQDEEMTGEMTDEVKSVIYDVRGETVPFHDLAVAEEAGYGKFLDCFQHGPGLGMGQHYVNGDLLGDGLLDPLAPEALVYEPREDGSLILVAFEYIIPEALWDDEAPPTLFDQAFSLKTNIPDTPPIWALHIWLWSHNPEGMFADYNPLIVCPADQPITEMMSS